MIRIIDDTHFELIRYSLTRKGNFTGGWLFGLPSDLKGTAEQKAHDKRKYKGWEGIPALEDFVLQESQGEIPDRRPSIWPARIAASSCCAESGTRRWQMSPPVKTRKA